MEIEESGMGKTANMAKKTVSAVKVQEKTKDVPEGAKVDIVLCKIT